VKHIGAALLCALGVPAALGCGYHDGKEIDRGMLNFLYPGALSVQTRTWMAEREGLVAANALGYLGAVTALRQWKAHIEAAGRQRELPSMAVVFVGPMLWSRYEVSGEAISLVPHVDGPAGGDVVVITDAAVLAALAAERLTLREAREMGVISFYGEAAAVRTAIGVIQQEKEKQ
jgi:hypothetical protein